MLLRIIDARHFAELKAYRNRNTLNSDVWFSMARLCAMQAASQGVESRPLDFVPVNDPHADSRREAQARAAEEQLDREAE